MMGNLGREVYLCHNHTEYGAGGGGGGSRYGSNATTLAILIKIEQFFLNKSFSIWCMPLGECAEITYI